MTKDVLDEVLEKALHEQDAAPEPREAFRKALLAETTRALPRPRGRMLRLLGVVAAAAAAILIALFAIPDGPIGVDREAADSAELSRVAQARDVPAFRAAPQASVLYLDPVEYLREHGVDVTVAGLVDLWRRMAEGEDRGIEMAKWAVLDALSKRAGNAFAPLLTELWAVDPDPEARRHILLMMNRVRDRAVAPWLDARLADATPNLLRHVAKARVALHLPGASAAAALRAHAAASGLLDPARPEFTDGVARDLLLALHALGHPGALDEFGRVLDVAPTPDLLFAGWTALGECPAPRAFRTALDRLAKRALVAEDPSFDDVRILDVLARTNDERFVLLLERLLADDHVPLAVDAARAAGAWRAREGLPTLLDAWERAKRMGEDGEDLIVPVLWAMARCGDDAAVPRLLAFLRTNEWYRAGEWAVDALLDLEAPVGEILLALPDDAWTVGRLPVLLAGSTVDELPALDAKIASLPDGRLKSALILVRRLGAGSEVLDYLGTVVEMGGNIGLHLRFFDPGEVRATIEAGSDLDATVALRALSIVPLRPEAKREAAVGALTGGTPRVRAEAADALARLGAAEAAAVLRARLDAESVPAVRERIALALAQARTDEAHPLLLGEVPSDSRLADILACEALLLSEPGVLRARLASRKDGLAEGYRLLLSGVARRANPDRIGDLFDYEIAR